MMRQCDRTRPMAFSRFDQKLIPFLPRCSFRSQTAFLHNRRNIKFSQLKRYAQLISQRADKFSLFPRLCSESMVHMGAYQV
ncbi:hypothetical protein D3C75_818380 [compost metagenome]